MKILDREVTPTGIIFLAVAYVVMAALLTCGCALHVGEAPCIAYARAVQVRLVECELTDSWYQQRLAGIYAQCDTGPLGVTIVDSGSADACIDRVRETSCEQLQRGAPTCISELRL